MNIQQRFQPLYLYRIGILGFSWIASSPERVKNQLVSNHHHQNISKIPRYGGFLKQGYCTPKSSILMGFPIVKQPFWRSPWKAPFEARPCLATRPTLLHRCLGWSLLNISNLMYLFKNQVKQIEIVEMESMERSFFFVDQCLILCIIISAVKLRDNQRSCPNNSCRHSAGARIDTLQTLLDFTQVPAHRFKRANHILAPRSGTLGYLGYLGYVGYLPKLCSKSSC